VCVCVCVCVYTYMFPKSIKEDIYELCNFIYLSTSAIMKILYMDENHFISYRCFNSTQLSEGMCPHKNEAFNIFSRRKRINEVHKQHLTDVLVKQTCIMRSNLIIQNSTGLLNIKKIFFIVQYFLGSEFIKVYRLILARC